MICFVDFSKAFDLVNQNILFYEIMKSGWHGKVIDTLRSLYSKTSFRVKNRGWTSFLIHNVLGVNQGGIASGLLFRKYMADMGDYLKSRFGVCMGHSITMHLLWADDLVLISVTCAGLQKQLDGLQNFCTKNLTALNEIKTKCVTFGKTETINVTFNNKSIAQVAKYKFLGNIIKSVRKLNPNILAENQQYLSNQANRAIGAMYHRLRTVGTLPPHIMLHVFNGLIKPIIAYGSEVWGYNSTAQEETDKVLLRFARQILRIKPTTSNIMIFGE